MENEDRKLIRRIKNLRQSAGLSYQKLADRTGLSKSTLQRYESGAIKNIPLDKLSVLADGLGVTSTHLLGWDHEAYVRDLELDIAELQEELLKTTDPVEKARLESDIAFLEDSYEDVDLAWRLKANADNSKQETERIAESIAARPQLLTLFELCVNADDKDLQLIIEMLERMTDHAV